MQIQYILIYFIHHTRTGPLHTVTSGQITVTVPSHQFETQGTKTQAKSWLTVLHRHNQWQTSQPKQSIISTYHYVQLQKILPDRFPVTHPVQN